MRVEEDRSCKGDGRRVFVVKVVKQVEEFS